MVNIKEPVRLRQKKLSNGNISLYLDIYIDGKRKYEFLKLYLIPETDRKSKEKNKQTLQFAEAIRSKRVVELRNGEYGFRNKNTSKISFYDYYCKITADRLGPASKGNWGNWRSCLKHIEIYDSHICEKSWDDITKDWVIGFRDYLEKDACAWSADYRERVKDHPLSENSKCSYFRKLKACCNQAFEDGVIDINPCRGVEGIKQEEGHRMYLTIDEVKKLAQTECHYPSVKKAFLFSCLTGLRRSDVLALTWGEVYKQDNFTRIIFNQKKTGGLEYLDITKEAALIMGERGKATDHVFEGIHSPTVTNSCIRQWCMAAGIQKDITFHCGRHTFATMMLDLGTDIYTVSKLLGHRELTTTQIYAKVLDKNKQKAVSNIPDILGSFRERNEDK